MPQKLPILTDRPVPPRLPFHRENNTFDSTKIDPERCNSKPKSVALIQIEWSREWWQAMSDFEKCFLRAYLFFESGDETVGASDKQETVRKQSSVFLDKRDHCCQGVCFSSLGGDDEFGRQVIVIAIAIVKRLVQ